MWPPWRLPGLLAVAVTLGLGASAADDCADIEDLRRRIEQLEAGRPRVGSEITQAAWSTAASPPRRAGGLASAVDWSGFLQLDAGAITADDVTTDEVGSINAQIGPRRVRLKAAGSVTDSAEFIIDLDFAASGSPSFRDVAVLFEDVPYVSRIEIGRFKQPIGLDAYTSGRELLFMERQLPFAFLPFRQTGVKVGGPLRGGGLFEVAAYVFPTDSFGVSIGDSGGQSLATRLTRLLVDTDDWLVHVGGGYVASNPANNRVRFAIEPGFFVTDPGDSGVGSVPVFVDTGRLPTNTYHVFNIEFAAARGPLTLESEARWALVDRLDAPATSFNGFYFQLGWILIGERRPYRDQLAAFGSPEPQDPYAFGHRPGLGVVELACGFATIDLNDGDVRGGVLTTFPIGVNWYPTRQTRLSLNVVPNLLDTASGDTGESVVFAGRMQVTF